jgi:hypothetical protein
MQTVEMSFILVPNFSKVTVYANDDWKLNKTIDAKTIPTTDLFNKT